MLFLRPVVVAGAVALLTACAAIPNHTTLEADRMHGVWSVFIVASIVVYAIVAGLIVFSAIAYRRRGADVPQAGKFHKNYPLEIAWTIIPILIVGGLFWVTYDAEFRVDRILLHPPEVIEVTAYRWGWRFYYPKEKIAVEGTERTPPTLVLPLRQTVEIDLTSSDVLHGMWVPAFLFKRDAVPGKVNKFDWNATQEGFFPGRCSEFCGLDHANMWFNVRVVPPDQFARWGRGEVKL